MSERQPTTTGMDGVLVCADGRTIAVYDQQPVAWFVLARELDYSKRRAFFLVDGGGGRPLVWTERTIAEYDAWRDKQPMRAPRDVKDVISDLFRCGR